MAVEGLLTDEWLERCNEALAGLEGPTGGPIVLTERVTGTAPPQHHAVTLLADEDGVRLVAGGHEGAAATITLSVADALALQSGELSPSGALSSGRVRVRGDLRAVIEGVALLARAHELLRARHEGRG